MAKSAITINKISEDVSGLKQDMQSVRSLLISMVGRDAEGKYNPSFASAVLKAAREEPEHVFVNPKQFLSQLRRS